MTQHRNIWYSKMVHYWCDKEGKKVRNKIITQLAFVAFLMIQVKEVCLLILGFPNINHLCANQLFVFLNVYYKTSLLNLRNGLE